MIISVQDLENFILESQSDLVEIKESLNEFNIFNVLGVQRREIRHSNFLGWLFDPNGSHKLKDLFLKELLRLVSEIGSLNSDKCNSLCDDDLFDTMVHRESFNNIDILLINKTKDFVICIENKIDHHYAPDQLEKYYNFVERNFHRISHRCYITLTPFKTQHHKIYPCGENYNNISYKQIADILRNNSAFLSEIDPSVKESINQYRSMVEKDITQTNPEVLKAQRIYKDHREAIEFIIKHKPNFIGLEHSIRDCFINLEINGFLFTSNEPTNALVRILPDNEELLNIFKKPEFKSWYSDYMFCLEIHIEPSSVWMRWSFGDINAIENVDDMLKLRYELYGKMKKLEVYHNFGLEFDDKHLYSYGKNTSPGVGGIQLFNEDDYLSQEKPPIELFKIKFAELNEKLIQPWTEACIKHLRNYTYEPFTRIHP